MNENQLYDNSNYIQGHANGGWSTRSSNDDYRDRQVKPWSHPIHNLVCSCNTYTVPDTHSDNIREVLGLNFKQMTRNGCIDVF